MPANAIDLCQLADVKAYLGIPANAAGDDTTIQEMITGASQYWLTRTCRGSLNSVATYTERYDGPGKDQLFLNYFPVKSVTSLTIDGQPISPSPDYLQDGWVLNNEATGVVLLGGRNYFWWGRLNVAITYQAGYSETPFDIAEAVKKQVAVNYKRRSTTDQSSIALPQGGGTTSLRGWELPPEVESVLERYRRLTP